MNNFQAGDEAFLDAPLPKEAAAADAVLLPQRAFAATYEPESDAEAEVEVEVEVEEYPRPPQREHAGNTMYEDAWTQHPDADEEPEVYGAQRQPADSWRLNADGVWTTEEN